MSKTYEDGFTDGSVLTVKIMLMLFGLGIVQKELKREKEDGKE